MALGDRISQKTFQSRTDFNHTKYLQYQNYVTYMWHVRMGEERNVHRVLVGKPEGKRSLGKPRHRWEDNIKIRIKMLRY